MSKFHLFKKVIQVHQLVSFCKYSDSGKCNHKLGFGGVCTNSNDTKANCPIWNGDLDNLVMLHTSNDAISNPPEIDSGPRPQEAKVVKAKRGFTDD